MENNAFIRILILFVLASLHYDWSVHANLPNSTQIKMVKHIKKEHHWQGMWFNNYEHEGRWKPIKKVWVKNSKFLVAQRLKLVSPMMGCAYGINLNYFLLLTLVACGECNKMQKNDNEYAIDCRIKLEEIIERGKFVILKLMRILKFVDPDGHVSMDKNRFYNILLPLNNFVGGQVPVEFSGVIPGGIFVNELFNEVADSLRQLLHDTCFPEYQPFNLTQIESEHNSETHRKGIYSFHIDKLNSFIDYIDSHLIQLGFHYNLVADEVTFDPSISAANRQFI